MSRYKDLLRQARAGLSPWDRLTPQGLAALAAKLTADEIPDIVAALDDLAIAKSELPQWDGDSADDISDAQATHAAILQLLLADHRNAVEAALASPYEQTRMWVRLALDGHAL